MEVKIIKFDVSSSISGGYMFFETSLLSAPVLRVDEIIREGQNAYVESVTQGSTGPEGKCVQFR